MKRALLALLALALAIPGCRSAGARRAPAGPAAVPESFRAYVGEMRLLRHKGDQRVVTLKAGDRMSGDCDLAVRVRSAAFDKQGARLALETLGIPRVAGREGRCKTVQPAPQLVLTGLTASATVGEVAQRLDPVLQTPEAFLQAKGVPFTLAAAPLPTELASTEVSAPGPERLLGMKVTSWPKPLLSVNAYVHDLSGRVHQESEVEFEGVVGPDGRLYQPALKTPLTDSHSRVALSTLGLWRFEPARVETKPVGARLVSRMALRVD